MLFRSVLPRYSQRLSDEDDVTKVPRWLIMPYGVNRLGFDCTGMAMIMWLALEIPFTLAFVQIDNAAYQFFSPLKRAAFDCCRFDPF